MAELAHRLRANPRRSRHPHVDADATDAHHRRLQRWWSTRRQRLRPRRRLQRPRPQRGERLLMLLRRRRRRVEVVVGCRRCAACDCPRVQSCARVLAHLRHVRVAADQCGGWTSSAPAGRLLPAAGHQRPTRSAPDGGRPTDERAGGRGGLLDGLVFVWGEVAAAGGAAAGGRRLSCQLALALLRRKKTNRNERTKRRPTFVSGRRTDRRTVDLQVPGEGVAGGAYESPPPGLAWAGYLLAVFLFLLQQGPTDRATPPPDACSLVLGWLESLRRSGWPLRRWEVGPSRPSKLARRRTARKGGPPVEEKTHRCSSRDRRFGPPA